MSREAMSRIKVMLIEDDYYSRYALYSLLSKDNRTVVIDEAADVEEAEWSLKESGRGVTPDVVLFDADLFGHDADSIAAIERLVRLAEFNQIQYKIVCCAMNPSLDLIRAAIELGVDAIVRKGEVANNIADVVEKVHQGFFVYTRSVSEKAFGRIQGVRHSQSYLLPLRQTIQLDPELRRVARLYCEDNMTAAEIAKILHLSESGVRSRVQRIYQTLGVHTRKEARQKLLQRQ